MSTPYEPTREREDRTNGGYRDEPHVRHTNGNRSSSEIREEIDRTRQDIDVTLDEIGDRLHPRHLIDDIIGAFRGSVPARSNATARIVDKVKGHPVPAALIGVGLAWLLMEEEELEPRRRMRRRRGERVSGHDVDRGIPPTFPESKSPPYGGPGVPPPGRGRAPTPESFGEGILGEEGREASGPGVGERVRGRLSDWAHSARERARSAGEGMSSMRHRAGSTISGASGRMRDKAGRAYESVRDTAGDAARRAQSAIERGRDKVEDVAQEYPLAMGVGCAALGMLAGLLIPRTQMEDERMGRRAEQFRRRVRRAGEGVMESAKEIAGDAVETARDEAERQGIAPGELGEKAGRVVDDVARAASESARREGVGAGELKQKVETVVDRTAEKLREDVEQVKDANMSAKSPPPRGEDVQRKGSGITGI